MNRFDFGPCHLSSPGDFTNWGKGLEENVFERRDVGQLLGKEWGEQVVGSEMKIKIGCEMSSL